MRLVVGQGMRLAGTGVVIGIAAAMLFGRLIVSHLFEVRPFDPPPARRAMRADPAVTLRYE